MYRRMGCWPYPVLMVDKLQVPHQFFKRTKALSNVKAIPHTRWPYRRQMCART